MAAPSRPRHGSLQFYPRNRAEKFLNSVNWSVVKPTDAKYIGLLGFVAYKVGMATAHVKDLTDKSMIQNKKTFIPVTILEAPNMKIFSVRFYSSGKVIKEVVVSNDKELKRVLSVPKTLKNLDSETPKEFQDVRVIVYSLPKQTSVKKTPDLIELAIAAPNKLEYVKSVLGKEIVLSDFAKFELLDSRALTKGKGTVGPLKRFGLEKKAHKSEKGVRRPGSLAPWHPARVTFKTPLMGQMGLFSRINYNNKVITSNTISQKDINKGTGFPHYGKIKSSYIIVRGSIQGPSKRQVLLTPSFRPTKEIAKRKYEFLELIQ